MRRLMLTAVAALMAAALPPAARAQVPATGPDARYADGYQAVLAGGSAVLCVGRPPTGTGAGAVEVPSGYLGYPDGVYDCRLAGGKATTFRRPDAPEQAVVRFAEGGSGVAVRLGGRVVVLTAKHVVLGNTRPAILAGGRTLTGTVLAVLPTADLAAVEVAGLPAAAELAESAPPPGAPIRLLGYPVGATTVQSRPGVVLDPRAYPGSMVSTAAGRRGDSGGGVFDASGRLCAVNYGASTAAGGLDSYAVPLDEVRRFVAGLPATGAAKAAAPVAAQVRPVGMDPERSECEYAIDIDRHGPGVYGPGGYVGPPQSGGERQQDQRRAGPQAFGGQAPAAGQTAYQPAYQPGYGGQPTYGGQTGCAGGQCGPQSGYGQPVYSGGCSGGQCAPRRGLFGFRQ